MAYPKEKIVIRWSKKFAYCIGLLASDGCLSKDGRHIDFTSKDRDQVELFKSCLGLEVKIGKKGRGGYPKKIYYRVQFGDVMFYRWLLSIGFSSKKSRIIGVLKVPKKYFFDFLRGEFDGDGCIYSLWDPYWPKSFRYYTSFFSGSRLFINWLRKSIMIYAGIKGFIEVRGNNYALKFGKAETNVLFNKIYPTSSIPCLERKSCKAKHIFKQEQYNRIKNGLRPHAAVVKLANTLRSGRSGRKPLEVQVLSAAPRTTKPFYK